MADNTTLNPGTGGDVIASDDIAGVKYQIVKIGHGLADAAPVHTSATNPMPSVALGNGLVSTSNSSAVNLAAAAVFTGVGEDVSEYASIVVSLFSSHASATDGLSIQQSTNNADWDHTDVFTIPAATGKSFSVPVQGRFFRVVYTNGATLTTAFRLQTIFHKQSKKGSAVRPQDGRTNDNDFEEVLGYGMVYNGTTWERARGNAANGALMQMPPVTPVTVLSTANTIATLTIPAPGAGLFHYITRIRITMHNTSATAVAGSAVALAFTSTNIPGALAWTEGNALAAGSSKTVVDEQLENAVKTTAAATATTIAAPACGLGVQARITAYYYTGL